MKFRKQSLLMSAAGLLFLLFIIKRPTDTREKTPNVLIEAAYTNTGTVTDSNYVVYKKIHDSLEHRFDLKDKAVLFTAPLTYMPFGVVQTFEDNTDHKYDTRSWFLLKGVSIQSDSKVIIDKGNYYLQSPGTGRKNINGRLSFLEPGDKGLTLMIPVSTSSYKWIKAIMNVIFWVTMIVIICVSSFGLSRVLRNISEGKPFLPQNSKYLSWLGWTIIIVAVAYVLLPVLIRSIFLSNIPGEVSYPFWSWLYDLKWALLAGIVILGMAQAFKHGYQIQKEQDLTV